MPGLVPLLSGLDFLPAPTSHIVVPGLVPGIHVPPQAHPLPAHTATPQYVDARNQSGHDERRDVGRGRADGGERG